MKKDDYFIEDQVNDCFHFLGKKQKDAHEMDERELSEAEREVANDFTWVEHPNYIQFVPKHIVSGTIIEPNR